MSEVKINNYSDVTSEDLVKSANKVCEGIDSEFNKKSLNMCGDLFDSGKVFYLNPTEELRMGDFVKAGTSTATVLGSGDFAIDSIYHGVKNVTCFDINKYQFFPASLKLKALQHMSYSDYCNFFSDNRRNSKLFDLNMYEELKNISSRDEFIYTFMDIIIGNFNKEKGRIKEDIVNNPFYSIIHDMASSDSDEFHAVRNLVKILDYCLENDVSDLYLSFIFSGFGVGYVPPEIISIFHGLETITTKNSYLENEISYNKAKDLINNSRINFVNCDVSKLEDELKNSGCIDSSFKGFQSIYLSNIPEYMRGDYFVNNVIDKLMNILTDDGIIAYCCQGVTKEDFNSGKDVVFDIINDPDNSIPDRNHFNRLRLVNDICGHELLKRRGYDFYLDEAKSLSIDNGYHDKDTFVYVKKR